MQTAELLQDFRYAFRQFRKSPGFTGAAILTLALGIAATAVLFSILDGAYIHFGQTEQANRAVLLTQRFAKLNSDSSRFSPAEYFDIAGLHGSFDGFFALHQSVGLYALVAYSVAQRTREIGIRMAMGARREDVLHLVVKEGMALAVSGLALGFVASFGLTRLMSTLLYGVRPNDVATLASASTAWIGIALLASYIPARRAARVDPMVALRYE